MRPLTEAIPKVLLPVAGAPFLHYQLGWLSAHGVNQVVLCIGHLGQAIRDFVGSGSKWGVEVSYVDEGDCLRGTAGALRLACDEGALGEWFFVLYGDSFLPVDFKVVADAFKDRSGSALMTVYKNEGRWDTSNVVFEEGKVALYDKRATTDMHYIDYGLSVFRRAVIEAEVPAGEKCDLAAVFHRLSLRGELLGHEVHSRFYEIGSPSGLKEFAGFAQQHLGDGLTARTLGKLADPVFDEWNNPKDSEYDDL